MQETLYSLQETLCRKHETSAAGLTSAKRNMSINAISRELKQNVSELKRTIQSEKEKFLSLNQLSTTQQRVYSPITESSNVFALELKLRFSEIPEIRKFKQ